MSKYEIVYLRSRNTVRSEIYDDREKFIADFRLREKSGKPCMAQGPDRKTGKITVITRNGWKNADFTLTAVVDFGSGKKYSYSASKHYSGLYEVTSRDDTVIVAVAYEWRLTSEFNADLAEKGYKEATSFESILVRKVEN